MDVVERVQFLFGRPQGDAQVPCCTDVSRETAPQATVAFKLRFQSGFPRGYRMDRDAEVVRIALVPMSATRGLCQSSQATFLELSTGVMGVFPIKHTMRLSTQIYVVLSSKVLCDKGVMRWKNLSQKNWIF